jgi:hypothetical protein
MRYKLLMVLAVTIGCGDGVIVKVREVPRDRGVLELNCRSVGGLISHEGRVVASCRRLGRNEFVLPVGPYMLKLYAAGRYDQYVTVVIKSMETTKLSIELLKAPPR